MFRILKALSLPLFAIIVIGLYITMIVTSVQENKEKEKLNPVLHRSDVKEECLRKVE